MSQLADRLKFWAVFCPSMLEIKNFVHLSSEEASLVLSWRNHPEIRKFMFRQEPISLEEHLNFLKTLVVSTDRFYYLICLDGPLGVVYFTDLSWTSGSADIGLYRSVERRGVGKKLMEVIDFLAFSFIGLNEIRARVLPINERAINLYRSFGFSLESSSGSFLTFVKRKS